MKRIEIMQNFISFLFYLFLCHVVLTYSLVIETLIGRLLLKISKFPARFAVHVRLVLIPCPRAIKISSFTKLSNFSARFVAQRRVWSWPPVRERYIKMSSFTKISKFPPDLLHHVGLVLFPRPRAIKMSSFSKFQNFLTDLQHTLVGSSSPVREPLKCRFLLKFQNFPPDLLHHVGLVLFPSVRSMILRRKLRTAPAFKVGFKSPCNWHVANQTSLY